MKILIIYNSFTFIITQKKYFIYKRKLYIIITFIIKYDYLYKYLYLLIIIYIDYKPLTYFLSSNFYKKIYDY